MQERYKKKTADSCGCQELNVCGHHAIMFYKKTRFVVFRSAIKVDDVCCNVATLCESFYKSFLCNDAGMVNKKDPFYLCPNVVMLNKKTLGLSSRIDVLQRVTEFDLIMLMRQEKTIRLMI